MDAQEALRERLMTAFTEMLPTLRTRLKLSQAELGQRIGATRQTIHAIESRKRQLTWNMFLSLVFVFWSHPDTKPMLQLMEGFSEKLSQTLFGNHAVLEPSKSMLTQARTMINQMQSEEKSHGN